MKENIRYKKILLTFMIISIIGSIITSIIVEMQFAIRRQNDNLLARTHRKISRLFNYTPESEPEWFKVVNNAILSIFISLIVYHLFLFILGKNIIYKYYFGNIH